MANSKSTLGVLLLVFACCLTLLFLNQRYTASKFLIDLTIVNYNKNNVETLQTQTTQLQAVWKNDYTKHYSNISLDLSIIIGTRNDNYGNNPNLRLKYTLQQLLLYNWTINIEIIIVEWNYLNTLNHIYENKFIIDLIHNTNMQTNDCIKNLVFIRVPNYFNDIIQCNLNKRYCPYLEYRAKNVGLRKSIGRYKLITNIDDIFTSNLLGSINRIIKYKTYNENVFFQSHRNKITMDAINKYHSLYNNSYYQFLQLDLFNTSYEECKPVAMNPVWGIEGTGGDFLLLHNSTLYNYFGGAFLESCFNWGLDSEMIARLIHVNKLTPYYFHNSCNGQFHITHSMERGNRKETKEYNESMKLGEDTVFTCNNKVPYYFYIINNKHLPNDSWTYDLYIKSHYYWGLKSVKLEAVLYEFKVSNPKPKYILL